MLRLLLAVAVVRGTVNAWQPSLIIVVIIVVIVIDDHRNMKVGRRSIIIFSTCRSLLPVSLVCVGGWVGVCVLTWRVVFSSLNLSQYPRFFVLQESILEKLLPWRRRIRTVGAPLLACMPLNTNECGGGTPTILDKHALQYRVYYWCDREYAGCWRWKTVNTIST